MKKSLLILCCSFMAGAFAQLPFSDNFDAYTANAYIGTSSARWTTFSGVEGGAEDAKISSTKANTGANSLYLSSIVEAGGPTDIILPVSNPPINTGVMTFQWVINVEGAKGAQINIQGGNIPGSKITLRMDFEQASSGTGNLKFSDATGVLFNVPYTVNIFVPIKLVANLNNGKWDVYVQNLSLIRGSFYTKEMDVASMEFFPINTSPNTTNNSGFYIDDISINHTPFAMPARNAALGALKLGDGLAGKVITPKVTVRNVGTNAMTSVTIGTSYAAKTTTKTLNVSLASGAATELSLDTMSLVAGTNVFAAFVTAVNGTAGDDNKLDDTTKLTTVAINPAPFRNVVAEEATGTWCQWCPRGAVYMDYMDKKYGGNFVGIAVHNGNSEPMRNKYYDSCFAFVISGYPSAAVDRIKDIDPSELESNFLSRINITPVGKLELTGNYDATTKVLKVIVTTEFIGAQAASNTYKLAVALTENGVKGTTSGYNQQNAYAGGKKGVMGGFESKPNPVPAADMVYDFVARQIVPSFGGKTDAYPANAADKQRVVNEFNINIDPTWDINNVMANALLIDPTGKINNGAKRKALDLSKPISVGIKENTLKAVNLFPNPSNGLTYVQVDDLSTAKTEITISELNGKTVLNEIYNDLSNDVLIPVKTQDMAKGIYLVTVVKGENKMVKKLIVE